MSRIAIEMPKLGYDMETGRVIAWLKNVGDQVARGEAVAETDKVTVEMEALASGVLTEIVHGPGSEVAVGGTIAWLEDGG